MTAYGAVNATVSSRAGSTARKQTSARPCCIASKESRAASKQSSSTGRPSRAPSSRAMSTVTPLGASAVPWASTGFPRLIEARSVPAGARSDAMSMPAWCQWPRPTGRPLLRAGLSACHACDSMANVQSGRESTEPAVSPRIMLSALWVTLVLFYLYADVLSLFRPGELEDISAGEMGPVDATQGTLFLAAVIVIVPALMVFLTWMLPPWTSRWTNLVLGVVYILVSAGNLVGESWAYYLLFGIVEVLVAVLIVLYAFRWH